MYDYDVQQLVDLVRWWLREIRAELNFEQAVAL